MSVVDLGVLLCFVVTFLKCVVFCFFFLHPLHSSLHHLTTLHSHKKKQQNMGLIMSSRNGSFMTFPLFFFFMSIGVSIMIMQARAQTSTTSNFSRFYCNAGDNATDPAAFLVNFNATHAALRANLSSPASTGFATAQLVRGGTPAVYAIFHCRGYLARPDCLACVDAVFAVAGADCYIKYRATVFTDGCYLRYAGTNVFAEVLNPGQSGFCDDPSPAESGDEFNATAEAALVEVRREVLARNGRFLAGRKGPVYAAGECLPILGPEDCRRCMESALRNVEGCLPGAGGRAVESACFLRYSGEEFFNGSLAVDLDLLRPGRGAVALSPSSSPPLLCLFAFVVSLQTKIHSISVWDKKKKKNPF